MNWVTTNIRFPEDLYLELKIEAAKRRVSLAEIVRERVWQKKTSSKDNVVKLMRKFAKIAREIAKQNQKSSLSKALIKMRYEQ